MRDGVKEYALERELKRGGASYKQCFKAPRPPFSTVCNVFLPLLS